MAQEVFSQPYQAWFPKYPFKTDSGIERAEQAGLSELRLGRVAYVDQEHLQINVVLAQGGTIYVNLMLSSDSSRSGEAGSLPSVNSYVLVGCINKGVSSEWVLLGTVRSGDRSGQALLALKEHPEAPESNVVERQLSRKTKSSEFQIMAENGGEALFDEGYSFLAKDLSEIKSDFITETQISNLHNVVTQSFNGRVQQGAAVRMLPDQTGLYAHPSGLTFQYVTPDGLDPALRYQDGSNPGLIATEEVHVYHELTDLIPDPTPYIEGQMQGHTTDLNEISTFQASQGKAGDWSRMSSDNPPDTQIIVVPLDDNPHKPNPAQKLYTMDNISIQHRKDLRYTHDSNLIGAFETDPIRYLSVLVPQVMFNKHETNFMHDHQTLKDPHPHPKFRLRVPVRAEYSPLIYNQTAYYQTKEGYQQWVMGATLPKENHPVTGATTHYKGAGRSAEIFTFGGLEAVLGKTQDEEESLSLTTIGQVFAHIGADSGKAPHAGRTIKGLNKLTGEMESLEVYNWTPLLTPGGNSSYVHKGMAENLSLVLTTDGGMSARFGARDARVSRKFVSNGFDPTGRSKGGFSDSHNANRKVYGTGDSIYSFHKLSQATSGNLTAVPCKKGADSYAAFDPDIHGRSWDIHLCSDWFMRVGKNPASGMSWAMDTDGGLLWWVGKDNHGRSLVLQADGGAQIHLNAASNGEALNLHITGNVNEFIDGSVTRTISGDLVEDIKGSRTVTVGKDDTIMIVGNFSPIFNNYTMLCNGKGVVGFGEGLNLSVAGAGITTSITGPTKTYMTGDQLTQLKGDATTTVEGATKTTVSKTVINVVTKSITNKVPLVDNTGVVRVEQMLQVDGGFGTSGGGAIPGTLWVDKAKMVKETTTAGIPFTPHTHPDAQGGNTAPPQ